MQGLNVVANMAKHEYNQLSLQEVKRSIEDNERMETMRKGLMLEASSIKKLEPWLSKNVVIKMRRLKTVGGATIDPKYSNLVYLLLCVS